MAGFQPLIAALPAISQGVGLVSSVVSNSNASKNLEKSQAQATRDLQIRQAENLRAAQENAEIDRKTIQTQAQEAERKRIDALKRAVARQRASFGASGLSGGTAGSSQAVLLGLFDESDDERLERERLDALRLGAIDQSIGQLQRNNLIVQSDLAEHQSVARAIEEDRATIGDLTSINRAVGLGEEIG